MTLLRNRQAIAFAGAITLNYRVWQNMVGIGDKSRLHSPRCSETKGYLGSSFAHLSVVLSVSPLE